MSDFDLDRLGDVWRQQPNPAEMERLQRSAAAVSRRARLSQIVDIVAAIAVAGVVIILVLSNPRSEAFVMGTAAILVLLYSNFRQRKLRQVELRSLSGSTEDMLDQSIERVEKTIKHNRFTLIAMGPGIVIGALFGSAALRQGHAASILGAVHDLRLLRLFWIGATVAVLAAGVAFFAFGLRRGRRELERLLAMRESYRQERESTAP
jgi:hypothetical protein